MLNRGRSWQILASILIAAVGGVAIDQYFAATGLAAERAREAAVAEKLLRGLADPQKPVDAAALTAGLPLPGQVLAAHPLDRDALLRVGLVSAAGAQGEERAHQQIGEALRRDPRARVARVWMMLEALKHGYNQQALIHIGRLMALDHIQGTAFFPMLAALAEQPGTQKQVAAMLAANPTWRGDFLGYLNGHHADPGLVFQLTTGGGKDAPGTEQAPLIQSLIDQQDYDRAYLTWVNFLPADALNRVEPVYDGNFKGLPGAPPFNWKLTNNDVANVTIEGGNGMVISYTGETATPMAEQMLLLDAQDYRLTFTAEGDPAMQGGKQILVRIYCLPQRTQIQEIPLEPGDGHGGTFTVPAAGCPAQTLSIEGSPGEFATQRELTLHKIAVTSLR